MPRRLRRHLLGKLQINNIINRHATRLSLILHT